MLELFQLFGTLVHGPYAALQPEIARTSKERVSLAAFSVYFGIGGAAIGLVGSGLLVDRFGFPVMAAALAGLALVTRYIGVAGV